VEEVIGYALYEYIEHKWKPLIEADSGLEVTSGWNMRIVEDDGVIDEDFPALERSRKISKFSFDQFALVPVNPTALKRGDSGKSAENVPGPSNARTSASKASPTGANTVFVKVHLYSTLEVKQTTTVALPCDMMFSEVLKYCCKKRKIDPNDYTLKMADTKTDIPLDRTVENLGITELCLLRKDRGPSGAPIVHLSADLIPHLLIAMIAGDIFLRPPDEDQEEEDQSESPQYIAEEYSSVYRKYNVSRKMAMMMGRQDRVLAIDGDYVYIMPPENKNMLFDNVKTTSFHISAVVSCQLQRKGSVSFKLTVQRDKETKAYEFDAATAQEARTSFSFVYLLNSSSVVEICSKISFMAQLNRGVAKSQ
jgi:hypothetical protein